MKYTASITYKDGDFFSQEFDTKQEAIRFAKEECKWEETIRAVVAESGSEVYFCDGDFAYLVTR